MSLTPNYYRDRVCLNVLVGSKENAVDIYEAAEGHVLVGVFSKNYPDIPSAVADMQAYAKLGAVSEKNTPEQFGTFIKSEVATWAPVVKTSGATVD